jgi:hypothetical protein
MNDFTHMLLHDARIRAAMRPNSAASRRGRRRGAFRRRLRRPFAAGRSRVRAGRGPGQVPVPAPESQAVSA